MGLRWKGPSARQLGVALANASREARAEARNTAYDEAMTIKEIGEDQAPLDTGELEQAFDLRMNRLRSDRTLFNIEVGGFVDGVDVSAYAWVMHESSYRLGPLSQIKQSRVGRAVGPKYLERAFEEREGPMIQALLDALYRGAKQHVG